jgi:hypothetical protein
VVVVLRALPELALGLAAVVFLVAVAFLAAAGLGVVVAALEAVVFLVAVALAAAGFYQGCEYMGDENVFAPARLNCLPWQWWPS